MNHQPIQRLTRLLPKLCFGAGLFGILLRWTIRDSIIGFSTFFYALPLPVCFAAFVAGTVAALVFGKRKRLAQVGFCLSLVGAALWLAGSVVWNSKNNARADLRIAFWNAADDKQVFTRALNMAGSPTPDIFVYAETGKNTSVDEVEIKKQLTGYQLVIAPRFVAVAARGKVELISSRMDWSQSMLYVFRVTLEEQAPLHIVVADIFPNAIYSRKQVIEEARTLAGKQPRTLVIGDFNTPWESVWFDPWREQFLHAFETAGRGLRETWPWPLPALALDHLWSSHDLEPVRAEKRHSLVSDHAMLVVDYLIGHQP